MRILSLIALSSAFLAVPAAADVVHQTSFPHDGGTISVSYEPLTKTSLRQSGLGPRGAAACLWKSEVSVERKLADANGRSIEALTRTVGQPKVAEGLLPGYCTNVEPRQTALFGGNAEKMRSFLAKAADGDKQSLHTELASLGALGRGVSR